MNLEEFELKFENMLAKQIIAMTCEDCGKLVDIQKHKAKENIRKNNRYSCHSCRTSQAHSTRTLTDDSRKRISEATSYARSEETCQKMSESAKKKWLTDWGIAQKKRLSQLTAEGHAHNKFENSKRQGWIFSDKNNCNIFYGSSYELRLIVGLEQDDFVVSYETQIFYETESRSRCLDCLVTYQDGHKLAIEVKPRTRLGEQANIDQIEDSRKFAQSKGWDFQVYTEDTFQMSEVELRIWADEYRSSLGDIDWVAIRKERDNEKAKKHYVKHIKDDKIEVYCEFCKENHVQLKLTYDKNVTKNGRFICIKENGHIIGSRSKKKEDVTEKVCKGPCGLNLPIDSFSKGKAVCKKCRAGVYKEKYHVPLPSTPK